MLAKIQETKSNLMVMAQEKLDEVTRRTMMDNDQLKKELRFQVCVRLTTTTTTTGTTTTMLVMVY